MKLKDPVSGLSHLAGALLGLGALGYFLARSSSFTPLETFSFAVFGLSLFLLYSSSALYHLANVSEPNQRALRRLDHSMIFVLIAGTYTPFCLIPLRGPIGWSLLGVVWGIAVIGVPIRIYWHTAPRWLPTALYVAMGWVVVVAIVPLARALTPASLYWLIAGGSFYTIGAVIYAVKWPDPFPPHFGFHEIWHLFVLAGSASHFLSAAMLQAR